VYPPNWCVRTESCPPILLCVSCCLLLKGAIGEWMTLVSSCGNSSLIRCVWCLHVVSRCLVSMQIMKSIEKCLIKVSIVSDLLWDIELTFSLHILISESWRLG